MFRFLVARTIALFLIAPFAITSFAITSFAITSFAIAQSAFAEDTVKPPEAKIGVVESQLLQIETLADARDLPVSAERVDVKLSTGREALASFADILTELSGKPELKDLTIYISNNSSFPEDALDVLQEFKNIETLTIRDARDYKSEKFYKQVAAVKGVKQLNLSFL